ncbi:hypothetical protein GW17_00018639 [Ensete ventricosum]|nr:hypothetical protein GW17_00018639 [Ensete ventricosum]RZR77792.1 hypothetical protein BHM03_00002985 [Ensete ventricosum]
MEDSEIVEATEKNPSRKANQADLEELPAKGPLPPLTRITTGARGRFRGGGNSSKEGTAPRIRSSYVSSNHNKPTNNSKIDMAEIEWITARNGDSEKERSSNSGWN